MAWNGDAMKANRRDQLAKRLIAAAIILQTEHTADLSSTYPPASKPGEFPHGRTWNLRSAIDYEPKTAAEVARDMEVRVGYQQRAWYILRLVKLGRKSLRDTMKRVRGRINQMLGTPVGG